MSDAGKDGRLIAKGIAWLKAQEQFHTAFRAGALSQQ
jgi:hypothetical protein